MSNKKSIDGLTMRRPRKPTGGSSMPKMRKPSQKSSSRPHDNPSDITPPIKPNPAKNSPQKKKQSPKPNHLKKGNPTSPTNNINTQTALRRATPEDFLTPVQFFNFDEKTGELQAKPAPTPSPNPTPTKKKPKKEKKKKRLSKKSKIIISIIFIIISLLIAAVVGFIIWGNDILARIGNGEGNIFDLFSEHYEPLKIGSNGRTNILAFGTSGYDMEGTEGLSTHDGAQLTDSIMVLSLDQESGDLAMLSLPRDLKVSYACTGTGKVNEVYWCNNMEGDNEQAGAEALASEVSDILGIDFQYYAHLNWGSLVQIVDQLGGITVTLDEDIEDYYYTKAVFEAGTPYTINGAEALGLARARHGTASGDFSRGASQQKILLGIKDRVIEKGLSLTDLLGLANTLGDNLRTNFSVEEMKTLAHLATTLDFDHIRQVSLIEPEPLMTTGTINGISYVIPVGGANYYTAIQQYVANMFSNDPRKYENSSILVLNGTGTMGVASSEQTALESDGFTNVDIDDAPIGEYPDKYSLYSLTDDKPNTKKILEEKYSVTSLPADSLPAGVYGDYDFIIILGDTAITEE